MALNRCVLTWLFLYIVCLGLVASEPGQVPNKEAKQPAIAHLSAPEIEERLQVSSLAFPEPFPLLDDDENTKA